MKRNKTSLPLTRFVAPKRLTASIDQVRDVDAPTSSVTQVDEEDTLKGTDETAENEVVENVVTADGTKDMDTSGSTIGEIRENSSGPATEEGKEDNSGSAVERDQGDKESDESPDPIVILKAVEALHQDFVKHQHNFDEFVNEANARIIKLEDSISSQDEDDDERKCREGIQELKRLMADTRTARPKVYVSALSFGDYDNQQSRTRSNLSRFTQLDSEDDSSPATIDPSILQPSHLLIESAQSPETTPASSSQIEPSSQVSIKERRLNQQGEPRDIIPDYGSPELNSDVDDLGPDSPFESPQSSPYQPTSSATAAASCVVSIAHSEYIGSSPPASAQATQLTQATQATQATQDTESQPPTQVTQITQHPQSTQILEETQSTELTQPTPTSLPTPIPTNTRTHPTATKRPRRASTGPNQPKPPPSKKQKAQKGNKKQYTKRPTTGDKGSLPFGTLKKSKGIKRVKGAKWPECGPNTVVGLAGYIECESCFGPVHRCCAGLRDEEAIPNLSWICPDCHYILTNGGRELPKVTDQTICIRHNCIRRYVPNPELAKKSAHKKLTWKPADAELYVIERSIGRRLLQPARSFSKGKYEYLTLWHGYPLKESTWEPEESFVAAEEMARQFVIATEGEGVDLENEGEGIVLLEEAKAAFGADGELKV